jgi:hypothetical protein
METIGRYFYNRVDAVCAVRVRCVVFALVPPAALRKGGTAALERTNQGAQGSGGGAVGLATLPS